MYATHAFEKIILDTFRNVTAQGLGPLYIGLYMSNPTDTGKAGVEVSYPGYKRLAVEFSEPAPESGGIGIKNTNELLWDEAPSDVGQIRFLGVHDSLTGGNMMLYGEFGVPLDIKANQQPSIFGGDLAYWLASDFSDGFAAKIMGVLKGKSLPGFSPSLALYSSDPLKDGASVELKGGGYARAGISFTAPEPQAGGQSQISNSALVRFPAPIESWGNWAYDAIVDALSEGDVIASCANPSPEIIQRNYVLQVKPGGYIINFN